jgi:hypothetical protein
LDGLLLHLQGGCQSPSYVDLEVDSSRLIFLGSGWSLFSCRLNLREGDMLCCRFDGESVVSVCAFDSGGNSMDPHLQESSCDSSGRSRSPTPASSSASSSGDSSGGGAVSISSGEDLDIKPPVKKARQETFYNWERRHLRRQLRWSWRRTYAAGEEVVQRQLEKKLVELEKKLVEHRLQLLRK